MTAYAAQPTYDVREMAPEHTSIGVQLVDDDETEVFEELRPSRMVRQDARVEHVGVAEHHVSAAADGAPGVLRRVAVVGEHAHLEPRGAGHLVGEGVQLGKLILRERLGREEIERAARRIADDGVEHRGVVAERLARGGGRGDDDVPPGQGVRHGFSLVHVEPREPAG